MPAITNVVSPNLYSPSSAEIWYGIDSPASTVSDFKYIINVNAINLVSSSATTIGTFKIPPRPVTGYGLFSPHKLLNSYLSYDLMPFILSPSSTRNSVVKYNFDYGYQYNINILFSDIVDVGGNAALQLTGASLPDLSINDIIYVTLDNQSINPQYNGIATITSITHTLVYYIGLNKPYVSGMTAESGSITQIRRMSGSTSAYYAYNGTRQFDEIQTDFTTYRVFQNDTNYVNALTNYNNDTFDDSDSPTFFMKNLKTVYYDQYETINIIKETTTTGWTMIVNTYDSSYSPTTVYSGAMSSWTDWSTNKEYVIPAGPHNLINHFCGVTANTYSYYSIKLYYAGTIKFVKYYKIVRDCSPYTNMRIAFQNRHGAFDYWNFNWKHTNSISTNKTEFRKVLDYTYSVVGASFNTVNIRQDTVLSQKANETYSISTDWITEYDSNFLKELITSPEVYWLTEDLNDKACKALPIIITDSQYTVKTSIDNKLFSLNLNFKLAYDTNTQTQ